MDVIGDMDATKSSRIFVGGLFDDVTEEDLQEKFSRFGEITTVDIKTKDGPSGPTKYAFIEMNALPSRVTKCLTTFSNTHWKGSTLKVQLAKESFLSRLQKERYSRLNEKAPISVRSSNEETPRSVRSSNDEPHRSVRSSNDEPHRSVRSSNDEPLGHRLFNSKRKRVDIDNVYEDSHKQLEVDAVENDSESPLKSIFLERLERYSGGVWKDDSAFEIVKKDYNLNPINALENGDDDDEEEENGEDEDAFANNLMKLKRRLPQVESPMSTKLMKENSFEKSVSTHGETSKMKHLISNERRLKTLDEKLTAMKLQQSLVKAALSKVDNQVNRKIVFDADDEERQIYSKSINEDNERSKKLTLFETDEFDADEDGGDLETAFQFKPQFEGDSGQKLIELQSRYGNDERFKIDKRFIEDGKHIDDSQTSNHEQDERLHNFNVLESVLGYQLKVPSDTNVRKKHWTEMIPERYDPASEGHEKYEIQRDPTEFPSLKQSSKSAKRQRKEQQELEKLKLPAVSDERFFEVEQNLADAFKNKSEGGTFILSKLFESTHGELRDDFKFDSGVGKSITTSKHPRGYWDNNPFTYDSSSDEYEPVERPVTNKRQQDQTIERTSKLGLGRQTFFLFKDDPRLKEGSESFRRHEDEQTIIDKWRSTRAELLWRVKMKRKRLLVKIAQSRKRENRHYDNKGMAQRKFLRSKQPQRNQKSRRNRYLKKRR